MWVQYVGRWEDPDLIRSYGSVPVRHEYTRYGSLTKSGESADFQSTVALDNGAGLLQISKQYHKNL